MTEEAIEAAKDGSVSGESSGAAATQTAERDGSQAEERQVRRVRRRPVVRPRKVAAAAGGGDANVADAAEPARPSNVISLNRRRRELDRDAQ